MIITLFRRTAICQPFLDVQLTGGVSHRFNLFCIIKLIGKRPLEGQD